MNDAIDPTRPLTQDPATAHPRTDPVAPRPEAAAWVTPGYTVVETALEVTAYSLATR